MKSETSVTVVAVILDLICFLFCSILAKINEPTANKLILKYRLSRCAGGIKLTFHCTLYLPGDNKGGHV